MRVWQHILLTQPELGGIRHNPWQIPTSLQISSPLLVDHLTIKKL